MSMSHHEWHNIELCRACIRLAEEDFGGSAAHQRWRRYQFDQRLEEPEYKLWRIHGVHDKMVRSMALALFDQVRRNYRRKELQRAWDRLARHGRVQQQLCRRGPIKRELATHETATRVAVERVRESLC